MPGPDASASIDADRVLGGRYRLVQPIARGGMAEVWEGYDQILSRPVAVKVLKAHLAADGAFLERFRREAITAARLAHSGVVATFDTGLDAGTAYIVMELVRGQTLRQLLSERGALPPALAIGIARQVADALAHAHRSGLVHRDIKPANLLLCASEGGIDRGGIDRGGIDGGGVAGSGVEGAVPRVKVTDFGIAKATEGTGGDLTNTGILLGTPKYLSPEQVEGREPDARADLYALGVVLFEMLTGRPPFAGPTELATAVAHLRDAPPRVCELRPGIPPALDQLVADLLAKDPADRLPSAAALRDALAAMSMDPTRDGRPSRSEADTASTRTNGNTEVISGVPGGGTGGRGGTGGPGATDSHARFGRLGAEGDPQLRAKGGTGGPSRSDPRGKLGGYRHGAPAGWTDRADGPTSGGATLGPPRFDQRPPGLPGPTGASRGASAGTLAGIGDGGTQAWPRPAPNGNRPAGGVPSRPISGPALTVPVAGGRSGLGHVPPPSNGPVRPGQSAPPRRRRRGPGVVVGAFVLAAVVIAALLVVNRHPSPRTTSNGAGGGQTVAASKIAIAAVSVFLATPGHSLDNPAQTPLTFDGNLQTAWSTDHYLGPHFGGLYPGEGLAIELTRSHVLHSLHVVSSTQGWSAQVYVRTTGVPPFSPLSAWGAPTATQTNIPGSATFSLGDRRGTWILFWMTDPGPAFVAAVAELEVS